jgi:hypothetical protein
MANIQIPERLFVELYKWFCIDPKVADYNYIVLELQKKNTKIAERLEYTAALSKKNKRDA